MTDELATLIDERDYHARRAAELSHRIHAIKCGLPNAETPRPDYKRSEWREPDQSPEARFMRTRERLLRPTKSGRP